MLINRSAILIVLILFSILFINGASAGYTYPTCAPGWQANPGCSASAPAFCACQGPTAPPPAFPCLTNGQADLYFFQAICGDEEFSPGSQIAYGIQGGVSFTANAPTNYDCLDNSGSGCDIIIVYRPSGSPIYSGSSGPNVWSLPACPATLSATVSWPTTPCEEAYLPGSAGWSLYQSGSPVTVSHSLPSNLPPGQYTFDVYMAETSCSSSATICPAGSAATSAPVWASESTVTIASSSSAIATVTPEPSEIIPGNAVSNVIVQIAGLNSATATFCTFYSGVFVNLMYAPLGTPAPACPIAYTVAGSSPTQTTLPLCTNYDTSSCAATSTSGVFTSLIPEQQPTCLTNPPSPTSSTWSMSMLAGYYQVEGDYNFCVYYSAGDQASSAAYVGSGEYSIVPYVSGYGLQIKPSTFLLGNTTIVTTVATSDYASSSTTPPNVCGPGDGGDHCYIEYAGQLPGASCAAPGYYSASGSWQTIATCTLPLSSSTVPCILQQRNPSAPSPTTDAYTQIYQNSGNLTYSQPMSTQYLTNGDYLVCMYDFTPIDWALNPQSLTPWAPYFATAEISCVDGVCGTASKVQPFIPPTCSVPPGVACPCGICATIGITQPYGGVASNLGTFGSTTCTIFSELNVILLIFAFILLLLGAAIYAGSSLLPSQVRGQAQSYAIGFVIVGIIAMVIAIVSVWAISVAVNNTIAQVLSYCTAFTTS